MPPVYVTCAQAKAARGCSDYGFHMAVTSWSDKVAAAMGELTKQGESASPNTDDRLQVASQACSSICSEPERFRRRMVLHATCLIASFFSNLVPRV